MAQRPSPRELDELGWALYKDRQYAQAAVCIAEALSQQPEEPLFLYHAAIVSYALGSKEQARQYASHYVEAQHSCLLVAAQC